MITGHNIMYKILGVYVFSVNPFPVANILTADNNDARKPPTISYMWALPPSVKNRRQQTICYYKDRKEKRNNGKPTHKTAHLQAPTHKPMLQLAKELFSCRRSRG